LIGCRDVRAKVLEQTLQKLGVEKLSKEDVHKLQWEVLEGQITNWIHFMRIAVIFSTLSVYLQGCALHILTKAV
jgi:hypothetical protein